MNSNQPQKKPGLFDQIKAAPKWVKVSLAAGLVVATIAGGIMDEVASRAEAADIQAANEAAASGEAAAGTGTTGKDDSVFKLRPGDCFRSKEAREGSGLDEVEFVDCGGSWDFVVLNSFVLADAEVIPSVEAMTQEASARCDRNFSDFMYPTESGWASGSRVVDCLMSRADFTPPAVGQCLFWGDDDELTDISFDGPHDLEVVVVTSYPGGESYPGDEEIYRFADEACFDALETHTSPARDGATVTVFPVTPSAATWSTLDDRTVTCYLSESDEPGQLVLMVGSGTVTAS